MGRDGAEEALCDGHHQGCRHAFAAYVSDAEEEFFVAYVKVVEVASHLLGRYQRGCKVQVGAVGEGREGLGYHGHLYLVANAQLVLDEFLLSVELFVFYLILGHHAQDDDDHDHSQYLQQGHNDAHLLHASEHILLGHDDGERPAGAGHGGKVDMVLLSFVAQLHLTCLTREHGFVYVLQGLGVCRL